MEIGPDDNVGACWECGYLLRGLSTPRCPECGRGFDPSDEKTMNMGTEVGRRARWLMRPPGWPLHLLTGVAVIVGLWACAVPLQNGRFVDVLAFMLTGMDWDRLGVIESIKDYKSPGGRFLLATAVWLLVVLIWIGRRLARGLMVRRLSRQKAAPFAYWRRWLITPVLFGSCVLVCRSKFPIWAGFWVSKPWLDQTATAYYVPPTGTITTSWLGVYPPGADVDTRLSSNDQVEIWVMFSSEGGYIYTPRGESPSGQNLSSLLGSYREYRVRRLSEHWYEIEYGHFGDLH